MKTRDDWYAEVQSLAAQLDAMQREREARAEIRRLKRILRQICAAKYDWQRVNLATFALSPRQRTTNRTTKAPAKPGRKP